MQPFNGRRVRNFGFIALALLIGALLWISYSAGMTTNCRNWQDWQLFKQNFISEGGRVIDVNTSRQQTVSEGQAYALFFALVANDRTTFDKLLQWTENNLAQGDLTAHLPAWLWGKKDDESWGVIDANSAADADLWLAYTLGEAGRLWTEPRYTAMSALLANRILRSEVAQVANLGPILLPGVSGFQVDANAWRLNPSYLPLFLLKRLATDYPDSPWTEILQTSERTLIESAPMGFAADWVLYRSTGEFSADPVNGATGSYDAIRVYLWAGMLSPQDPVQARLLAKLQGMSHYLETHGVPPETIDAVSGSSNGVGPSGFSAALLPFLSAQGLTNILQEQLLRLQAKPVFDNPRAYYDQVLALFGMGWYGRYFSFTVDGSLITHWDEQCAVSP
jgi:endoglucanase